MGFRLFRLCRGNESETPIICSLYTFPKFYFSVIYPHVLIEICLKEEEDALEIHFSYSLSRYRLGYILYVVTVLYDLKFARVRVVLSDIDVNLHAKTSNCRKVGIRLLQWHQGMIYGVGGGGGGAN